MEFKLVSDYKPTGDQPEAIAQLVASLRGHSHQTTLMGVTGSGKTFTVANVIEQLQRPVLVLCHNKTLAAQLYGEFRNFFPDNAVEFFVSYYDYYQPEAYLPASGTYIEKDLSINDEIEQLRLRTTSSLLSGRRDVIVVASVSCLYGIGNPSDFHETSVRLKTGQVIPRKKLLYSLVEALYTRTELELTRGTFRVSGDTMDVHLAFGETCYRIMFYDDEIEMITTIDPVSGQRLSIVEQATIYPANMFVTTRERINTAIGQIQADLVRQIEHFEKNGRPAEAQNLKRRVEYDLEMIKELGYCPGIENYSRYFDGRAPGERPFCLLDYFPEDFLIIADESHVSIPQVRGMYEGDRSRKTTLVDFGFRLPSAMDNRPLMFNEFEDKINQLLFVSATPSVYENAHSEFQAEQIIRPTGLLDPEVIVRPVKGQVDDLIGEINTVTGRGEKVLITTLTKKMAEDLTTYLGEAGIRVRYLHSDVETLERLEIIRDLRMDVFDVLVGINLLREGLDIPECSLVAILDADKEGFLRSATSLVQTIGRAARHVSGRVIMYADNMTDSMRKAISETNRRRHIQEEYNERNGITPRGIFKKVRERIQLTAVAEEKPTAKLAKDPESMSREEIVGMIKKLEKEMKSAAAELMFERAASLRDEITGLRKFL